MEAHCSECDALILIPADVVLGEIVSCPDCGLDFEVTEINRGHVMLRAAETTGEDWGE